MKVHYLHQKQSYYICQHEADDEVNLSQVDLR